jgi:hypothetical protein
VRSAQLSFLYRRAGVPKDAGVNKKLRGIHHIAQKISEKEMNLETPRMFLRDDAIVAIKILVERIIAACRER